MSRRLGLLVKACFGESWPVVMEDREPAPEPFRRLLRLAAGRRPPPPRAFTDGRRIVLPGKLRLLGDAVCDGEILRLAALTLAARLSRGSVHHVPVETPARDLYWIADGALIDALLAAEFPGLTQPINEARKTALAARPEMRSLTRREQAVEEVLRGFLAAPLGESLPCQGRSVEEIALWATCLSAEKRFRGLGRYRGLPPVPHWGEAKIDLRPDRAQVWDENPFHSRRRGFRIGSTRATGKPRRTRTEDDPLPVDQDNDLGGTEPAQEGKPAPAEAPARELFAASGSPTPASHGLSPAGEEDRHGTLYPEWDCSSQRYRERYCILHEGIAPAGSAEWVSSKLDEHRRLIADLRRRFEALRPRRLRLTRQEDGEEIDLDAYVDDFADRHAGRSPGDRLYVEDRRRRRDVSVAFLIDASGSTGAWVSEARRVVDVEKEAALVLCEAVEAVRDRYAVYAFSGWRPRSVRVQRVKSFSDRYGIEVRRRIAAVERDCFTRLGAPLRHLTAELARSPSRARVLFLLSDGKPNDADEYEGIYGIEDCRQAVAEARLRGIHVFCLTVDREGSKYLPRMFGANGYAVATDLSRLAERLPDIYRRITRG